MSWFQQCGTTHVGGLRTGALTDVLRMCGRNQSDLYCRDRFRLEITKTSLSVFVNGQLFFKDGGWPADHQLPDEMIVSVRRLAFLTGSRHSRRSPRGGHDEAGDARAVGGASRAVEGQRGDGGAVRV
jgi:hypothetical protein